jgi:hypothetical protein
MHVTGSPYVVLHADLDRKSEATIVSFRRDKERLVRVYSAPLLWYTFHLVLLLSLSAASRALQCSPFGRQLSDRLQHAHASASAGALCRH